METFLLDTLPNLVMNNPEVAAILLGLTGTNWVASILVALTKTRDSKWYKLLELFAFIWGKAKEEHAKK